MTSIITVTLDGKPIDTVTERTGVGCYTVTPANLRQSIPQDSIYKAFYSPDAKYRIPRKEKKRRKKEIRKQNKNAKPILIRSFRSMAW